MQKAAVFFSGSVLTTMPLTAAEILAHPAYNTVNWDLPPTKKGRCEVAHGRSGGPFKIHYEIHGTGDVKLVVSTCSFRAMLYDCVGSVRGRVVASRDAMLAKAWKTLVVD